MEDRQALFWYLFQKTAILLINYINIKIMNFFIGLVFIAPFLIFIYFILIYLKTRVPVVITPKSYYKQLFSNFDFPKNAVVYELGCAKGDFLFEVEKFEPKKLVGVDLSLYHILFARAKAKRKKSQAVFLCKDFSKIDFSDADVIYLFLVEPAVMKIWEVIKKITKPGTTVIVLSDKIPEESYFMKIPTRTNDSKSSNYYIYKT